MASEMDINGLHTFPLRKQEGSLVIAHEEDHRLRRFGILEVIQMAAQGARPAAQRAEADELWAVVDGEAAFDCVDKRTGSPSKGRHINLRMSAVDLEGIFIPFGVEFSIYSEAGARMVRLATHADTSKNIDRGHSEAE